MASYTPKALPNEAKRPSSYPRSISGDHQVSSPRQQLHELNLVLAEGSGSPHVKSILHSKIIVAYGA